MMRKLINKMKKINIKMRFCNSSKQKAQVFLFDSKTDKILSKIGYFVRKKLEQILPEKRKKIVYFLGYHHSSFAALIDAINILALQLRGAEVFPVISSYFYQKEDVIFGGLYNDNRFENQYNLSLNEGMLLSNILQTKTISLDAFLNKDEIDFANKFAQEVNPYNWKSITYEKMPIGEMAYYIVANMNNQPQMNYSSEHIDQFRAHIKNCVMLNIASRKLLLTVNPEVVVSNVPFYYQWKIPFLNSRKLNIPVYSYMLTERKNTIFWTNNSSSFYDSLDCWSTFEKSGVYAQYVNLVEQGIKDRYSGNISNHNFAPNANKKNNYLTNILSFVNERPTILFPCNVLTDAAVFVPTESFSSCIEMIKQVITWFVEHPKYSCIIKAHPAEKLWVSSGTDIGQMHLRAALEEHNIRLPDNVIFIDYDDDISVYALFKAVNGVIAYSSSVCIDAGFFGVPSISAHNSHYSMVGFSSFPNSKEEFFDKLESLLTKHVCLSESERISKLAKTYYLLYYYSGQVDYKLYQGNDTGTIPVKILFDSEEMLMPGHNKALDYICDSILNNKPIFGENRWPPITV